MRDNDQTPTTTAAADQARQPTSTSWWLDKDRAAFRQAIEQTEADRMSRSRMASQVVGVVVGDLGGSRRRAAQ